MREYTEHFDLPMAEQARVQSANAMEGASPTIGQIVRTRARVQLAALSPQDVSVELYVGRVDADGQLVHARPMAMHLVGPDGDGAYVFETDAALWRGSGLNGYTVRVLPAHPDLSTPFQPGLIAWANPGATRPS